MLSNVYRGLFHGLNSVGNNTAKTQNCYSVYIS
jgi:hypothetical protein